MKLQNKTIAITGAGRGLGAAMAQRLASQGCHLALIDLDQAALAQTQALCQQAGAAAVRIYTANVALESEVVALFDRIATDFGALHGLVNNAGITRDALTLKYKDGELVSKMTLEQWQMVIDVNLTGVFLCGREAAQKMITLECPGCIINISSISRHGNMGQANYAASKAGLIGLTKSVAKELASRNILANVIAPGFIETDMTAAMTPEARAALRGQIPLNRLGTAQDVASAVAFLASEHAAYITGQVLVVDGGLVM